MGLTSWDNVLGAVFAIRQGGRAIAKCYDELLSGRVQLRGDIDYVRKVIEAALDPQSADEILRYFSGQSMTPA